VKGIARLFGKNIDANLYEGGKPNTSANQMVPVHRRPEMRCVRSLFSNIRAPKFFLDNTMRVGYILTRILGAARIVIVKG